MKRHNQLGMNPSTASGRLVKDLLFNFAKDIPCYQCGGKLTRETFSIEHKVPWLDSPDPKGLFFDLSNISYSHHSCNVKAGARKRLDPEVKAVKNKEYYKEYKQRLPKEERQERRRQQYLRTGK